VTRRRRERATDSTFVDNLSLPVHRWFRYSAGFAAEWARDLIERQRNAGRRRVLDPFAGSGTVLLSAERCGVEAVGVEAHPFVVRIARAKLGWRESPAVFRDYALDVLERARESDPGDCSRYPSLIERCFPAGTLARLDALRSAWRAAARACSASDLTWLALVGILRECSPVGTAQWQYVLPNKLKARPLDPFEAFRAKVTAFYQDMVDRQAERLGPASIVHWDDARTCRSVGDEWADLVITSPPYANNFDYADATRLEMSFFGEIAGWGDLQESVRRHLVRACTQHVAGLTDETFAVLEDPILYPIASHIRPVCERLAAERDQHGGKKPYHTMIATYFQDMARTWRALRRVTKPGCLICCVIGDSAPYGIHVPVEQWLGLLALAAGFRAVSFEQTRHRNVKWKNRKHRVPLHEGRLWIEG